MEQDEREEERRITRIEEQMVTKEDLSALRDMVRDGDQALKDQIVGVKSDLQELESKVDVGFVELKNLIEANALETNNRFNQLQTIVENTKLEAENSLLKKIVGWGIPFGVIVIPAMISFFNKFLS